MGFPGFPLVCEALSREATCVLESQRRSFFRFGSTAVIAHPRAYYGGGLGNVCFDSALGLILFCLA